MRIRVGGFLIGVTVGYLIFDSVFLSFGVDVAILFSSSNNLQAI
jgi:hypothetical protein